AFPVRLATPGRHFAANAAGALAVVAGIGGDLQAAADGLASWLPPGGRGTRETVRTPAGAFALIDDAYNANPASLAAALEVLAAAAPAGGQRVAILGDMLELGPDEAALHAAVAALPAMAAIDRVHCAGPRMQHLHAALPAAKRGFRAETAAELAALLEADPGALARPGDVVLVKGSFGSRVATVVDALRRLGQGAAPATQDS
ncbi:MAG: UDP-N-acetylmuramoyl-tripeptide--D-alanyl-D-alanine ligase, partial [Mangrovicoccus sp.]|nr:UDP-N-acetylmuramoyl-tripeptide--D-alanyl-D-alanine ligase [Mangrovicoccus sp.]